MNVTHIVADIANSFDCLIGRVNNFLSFEEVFVINKNNGVVSLVLKILLLGLIVSWKALRNES